VAIVGAGVLGSNAIQSFLGLGSQVIVLDNDIERLGQVDQLFTSRITTLMSTRHNFERICDFVDVLVGAIHEPGRRAEQLITRDMVRKMRPGSVILDFSINDGGCVETSRPTTLRDPVYIVDEVIHFCVPNLPAAVSRTTSYGLTNALMPYLLDLGRYGIMGMIERDPGFAQGVHMLQGNLAHPGVAADLDREVTASLSNGEAR
jgi:alanine dehydrogenase